jgi:hypothetical protein
VVAFFIAINRLLGKSGRLECKPTVGEEGSGDKDNIEIFWTVSDGLDVEIRVGKPDGKLFSRSRGSGSELAGSWAHDGTLFYLVHTSMGRAPPVTRVLDAAYISWHRTRPDEWLSRQVLGDRNEPEERPDSIVANTECRLEKNPLVAVREWEIIAAPGVGEVFLIASYAQAFLDRYGGERLVVFAKPHLLDILRLFPNSPIVPKSPDGISQRHWKAKQKTGQLLRWDYPRSLVSGNGRNQYSAMRLAHSAMFLNTVGLKLDSPHVWPNVNSDLLDAAMARFREYGLVENRSVILAPSSKSAPQVSRAIWISIADGLRQKGFTVATNAPPGEWVVPGTIALDAPLSELYAIAELSGLLISSRSGICDLCAVSRTRLHILRPDCALVVFAGTELLQSLAEAGLPDTAVYHTIGLDETPSAFSERVLAHRDFN